MVIPIIVSSTNLLILARLWCSDALVLLLPSSEGYQEPATCRAGWQEHATI